MGPCSGNPHLRWASRLLGLLSLLFSVCRSGTNSDGGPAPGVQDSGAPDPLQGIRGGSVLFPLPKKQDAELEEVTWGFGPGSEYRVLLRVRPGKAPIWVSLQDGYQQRVHVPNMTSLKIENLTPEDSGLYRARGSFTGGVDFTQVFHLTVYEPVPIPQILVHSPSITQGWCNVTIECRISWGTEDLKVTWEGKGLPRQLEERVTLGPAPNSWNLAVHLPQSQSYTNITCVVSNEVDQKTATFDLGKVCHLGEAHGSLGEAIVVSLRGILGSVVVMVLVLRGGLYLWKVHRKKKKMETARGAGSQEDYRVRDCDI
ncbi:SLAM family member 9-like [Sus scrofa]|uniref:SLAM family member 9-like n=1 Tax=Sus scrofa TaxID=9823 RepID=UPI000A2B7F3A|nr:SLAM family member 9-like [Sus scrofa]